MATRYWVGGSGTWDASDTTHWSLSSGGAGGASVPTASDDVIFNQSSGFVYPEYELTLTFTDVSCNNFTHITPAGSSGIFSVIKLNGSSITCGGTFTAQGDKWFTTPTGTFVSYVTTRSATQGTPVTLSAATASLTYCAFEDITAIGSATWSGSEVGDLGGNVGFSFVVQTWYKRTYSNVAGYYSDTFEAWSLTSGGSPGTGIPLPQDIVIMDNNSEPSLPNNDISVSGSNGTRLWFCNNLDMSAYTGTLVHFQGGANVRLFGNLTNSSTSGPNGNMTFVGRQNQTITTNGSSTSVVVNQPIAGYTVSLLDNLTGNLTLTKGTFDANDKNVTLVGFFSSSNTNIRTLYMRSGMWDVTFKWDITTSTNLTLDYGTSTLIFGHGSGATAGFLGGGLTYGDVTFRLLSTNSDTQIHHSNTFQSLTFVDTAPNENSEFIFDAGTTQTVLGLLTANGSSANPIEMKSSTTDEWFISASTTYLSYVTPSKSHALGTAIPFDDSLGGVDGGGNTNWCFQTSCVAFTPRILII